MSDGVVGDCEETRTLRRNTRTRKGTAPPVVESSCNSDTDNIDTETETVDGWSGVEPDSVGEWSDQAQCNFYTSHKESTKKETMSRRDNESKDSGRGHTPGLSMNEFMQMFFEEQRRRDEVEKKRRDEEKREREEEQKRRNEERRQEREKREDERVRRKEAREQERREREEERARREEASRARDELLFSSLRDNRLAPPGHAPTPIAELPKMKDNDEMETFIPIFEASLRMYHVPGNAWKAKLTSQLPLKFLVPVEDVLHCDDTTYDDLVDALMGCSTLSFCSAAENMCTGEKGRLWDVEIRPSMTKMKQ